jgi:hypothetical protein
MSSNIQTTDENSSSAVTGRERSSTDRGAGLMENVPEELFSVIQTFLKSEKITEI